jgi:two-component system nitrate/nitrite response regulator NarL
MRVVIADDHAHYRRALGRMLRAWRIDVVAEVGDARAAVRAVADSAPDVALLDVQMPGASGADAARAIARRYPETAVLMLSVFDEEAEVVEAMVAGACGHVLKDRPVEELIAAIEAAAAGNPVVTPSVASVLLRRFRMYRPVPARP